MTKHLFIPDTQVKPEVSTDHIESLGNFIVEKKPDTIICIGDWADMPSLSTYDPSGSKKTEGQRYSDDIEASCAAMEKLLTPLWKLQIKQRNLKKKVYNPRMVMLVGNHEHRITRAIERNPRHFEGVISLDDLKYKEYGWEVHDFLDVVTIDGISYSHYFVNPDSLMKNALGGTCENKLKLLGHSFSMGHQQTLQYAIRYNGKGESIQGLVCGSFYAHDEGYLGSQGNKQHWRGVVMKHRVNNGSYDPMFVSIDYLLEKYL